MSESKERYWLVTVYGSTDPAVTHGPYPSWNEMVADAIVWRRDLDEEDGLFWVWLGADGVPQMGSFVAGTFEGGEDEGGFEYGGGELNIYPGDVAARDSF